MSGFQVSSRSSLSAMCEGAVCFPQVYSRTLDDVFGHCCERSIGFESEQMHEENVAFQYFRAIYHVYDKEYIKNQQERLVPSNDELIHVAGNPAKYRLPPSEDRCAAW
eukprot:215808-Amphidinium_carterae.1